MKCVFLILFLAANAAAQAINVVGPFAGLNNTDSSVTIADGEARDTLNVEVSRDAQYLKKRMGYLLTDTLTTSTAPVYGSIQFKDASGNVIRIFAHDTYVSKSVNGTSFVNIITSATAGAKWSFCESAGKVFGFNDAHITPWSWNGTGFTYYPAMPKASLCAITSTRMLLAGTTDQPNRLYFSEAGDYTNFVLGVDPESPSFDDIGLAGEKITNIFANETEWLIFKSNSFTSYQGTNQFDLVASVVSNKVGMIDPRAIVEHEGVVYFKGSDNKFWGYTNGQMLKLSDKIEGFTSLMSVDAVNQNLYTSKAEFDGGTYYNSTGSITAGSVEPYDFGFTDTTDEDFNRRQIAGSSATASNNALTINNFQGGTFPGIGGEWGPGIGAYGWSCNTGCSVVGSPVYGSYKIRFQWAEVGGPIGWFIAPCETRTTKATAIYSGVGQGLWTVNSSTQTRDGFGIEFYKAQPDGTPVYVAYSNSCFNRGTTQISFTADTTYLYFDVQEPTPVVSSATFVSQVSTISSNGPNYGYAVITSSNPKQETNTTSVTPYVRSSSASVGPFTEWQTTTNYALLSYTTNQYWQYKIDFSNLGSYIKPYVSDFQLVFKSTGYWESAETAITGFNSWGTFVGGSTTDGAASWTYQMKSSTFSGGTAYANWESVTPNVNISISTGSYAKVRATNYFTTATDTVRLNEVGYNYTFATDKQSAAFEYNGDIYFSVPYNYSTTNNRTLKLDTKTTGWNIFDIPLNSPMVLDNSVYFGSPTGGYIYQYPVGDNDNGAAINSYWKTKNYLGDNAYVEKEFTRLSLVAGSDYGSSLVISYTMDTTTSTAYSISLTSSTADFVRNNRALPAGEIGQFFNLQIGNNAANQPWSFYGASINYTNSPWRVLPEE